MPFGELPLAAQAALLSAETPKGVQIAAPLTNKGRETGWGSDNTFSYMGGPIRVTDRSGNVLFSGEGPEAAAQAVKFAQNLSDTMGPAAAWDIQQGERTINPDGTVGGTRWISGPTDVKDSDVGPLGLALDIGLPIAMNALLPGSGFLGQALGKVGATMAASGLGSALSGAVQGKSLSDIATSAGLSAATAGLLKGTPIGGNLDKAIGSIPVVGDVAKELGSIGTGVGAGAANAVGDEIIVNALPSLASSVVPSLVAPTLANSIANAHPTYQPPAASPMLEQPAAPPNMPAYSPLEDIAVTGTRLPDVSSLAVAPAVQNMIDQYAAKPSAQPEVQQPTPAQPAPPAPAYNPAEDIVATANLGAAAPSLAVAPAVQNMVDQYAVKPAVQAEVQQQPTNEQRQPVDEQPEIVSTAQRAPLYEVPAVSGALSNIITPEIRQQAAIEDKQQPVDEQPEIVATAQIKPEVVSGALSSVPATLATDAFGSKVTPEGDIVATAQPTAKPSSVLPGVPTIIDIAKTTYPEYTPPADTTTGPDLTVTAKDSSFLLPSVAGVIANQTLPEFNQNPATTTPETKSDLDKIVEYLRLAGLGTSLLGGLLSGGSKSKTAGTIPGGINKGLNPIFSAQLPAANLPGASNNFAARPASEIGTANGATRDWNKYGFGPEASFFGYVPKRGYAHGGDVDYGNLTPEEKNFVDYHRRNLAVRPLEHDGDLTTVYGMVNRVPGGEMLHPGYIHGRIMDDVDARDWAVRSGIDFPVYPDAKTALKREKAIHEIIDEDTRRYRHGDRDWLKGYGEGGDVQHGRSEFAVRGPGDGRSDDIPAVLSDGEYVMDAETVALLGNGSSKAGADALDRFRVNIRKHKGAQLAKGKFSVDAKQPERYLAGGRT